MNIQRNSYIQLPQSGERLFSILDNRAATEAKRGIYTYSPGIIAFFAQLFGFAQKIELLGRTFIVNKRSAQAFLDRNRDLIHHNVLESLSIADKLVALYKERALIEKPKNTRRVIVKVFKDKLRQINREALMSSSSKENIYGSKKHLEKLFNRLQENGFIIPESLKNGYINRVHQQPLLAINKTEFFEAFRDSNINNEGIQEAVEDDEYLRSFTTALKDFIIEQKQLALQQLRASQALTLSIRSGLAHERPQAPSIIPSLSISCTSAQQAVSLFQDRKAHIPTLTVPADIASQFIGRLLQPAVFPFPSRVRKILQTLQAGLQQQGTTIVTIPSSTLNHFRDLLTAKPVLAVESSSSVEFEELGQEEESPVEEKNSEETLSGASTLTPSQAASSSTITQPDWLTTQKPESFNNVLDATLNRYAGVILNKSAGRRQSMTQIPAKYNEYHLWAWGIKNVPTKQNDAISFMSKKPIATQYFMYEQCQNGAIFSEDGNGKTIKLVWNTFKTNFSSANKEEQQDLLRYLEEKKQLGVKSPYYTTVLENLQQ